MTENVQSAREPFVFNPFAEGFTSNPYPHYAELRATAPLHQHPLGFWVLSRYEDVTRMYRSGHSVDELNLTHVPLSKDDPTTLGKENRPLRGLSMLDQDPPDHGRLRRLVAKAFARRAIDTLQPRIETLVDEALDRIAEAGSADLVAEIAFPIPFAVISEMLGTPPVVDPSRLRDITGIMVRTLEPIPDPNLRAQVRAANQELMEIGREMLRWKRAAPGDDLLTALIAAEHEGERLSEDELISQVMFLYIAGHETTVNLIAGGILALLRHPDQLRLLQENPKLAASAVEELLRYDSPVQLGRRITTEPFRAHGGEIPVGAFVVTVLAAANRDPEFWGPDADTLRLERPNGHLNVSFGLGIHHCLGAALARLEGRVVLARFAQRFRAPVAEEVRWNGRINLRGPAELTVTLR